MLHEFQIAHSPNLLVKSLSVGNSGSSSQRRRRTGAPAVLPLNYLPLDYYSNQLQISRLHHPDGRRTWNSDAIWSPEWDVTELSGD